MLLTAPTLVLPVRRAILENPANGHFRFSCLRAVSPFLQLSTSQHAGSILALIERHVLLGLRPPGDGSHLAAAERRLMLTPTSPSGGLDRRFVMIFRCAN